MTIIQNLDRIPLPHFIVVLLSICTILFLSIILSRLNSPPISYLHSWNQITTLSVTREIAKDPATWTHPKEVVTRLSWLNGKTLVEDPITPFVIYEESPLYSLLITAITRDNLSIPAVAKIISLLALIIGAYLFYRTTKASFGQLAAILGCSIYLTSFPILYYGQATMSDMLMVSLLIAGTFLIQQNQTFWAVATLSLAALAKSYALSFAVPIYLAGYLSSTNHKSTIKLVCSLIILAAPVLAWHLFTAMQSGHQEGDSHSIAAKLHALADPLLYRTFLKTFFRYLGIIPGALFIFAFLLKRRLPSSWWIRAWLIGSIPYLIFTADKLIVHDYYYLPIFIPVMALGGSSLATLLARLDSRQSISVLIVAFSITSFLTAKNLTKAIIPNPDVPLCAQLAEKHSKPGDYLATLSDVSRFNSLAYLANRKAINVENTALPLKAYSQAGAAFLLLDLPQTEATPYIHWTAEQGGKELETIQLEDAKKLPRTCAVFSLKN